MDTARSGTGNGLPAGVFAEAVREAVTRKSPAECLAAVINMATASATRSVNSSAAAPPAPAGPSHRPRRDQ